MIKPYYQDEWATIYHGDCREILPHLAPVDLVLTDPPYGIGFAAQPTKWQRRAGQQSESWDNAAPVDVVLGLAQKARKVVIWGGNYFPLPISRGWLTWYKPDAPPSMGSVEMAWTNQDQNARQISHPISATNRERVGHPAQKPLAVIKWSIVQVGVIAGCVLDPFMGSGTTLVAAKNQAIKSIGIEIEEKYCQIAVERLRQESLLGLIERR
jgi:DNA modification methylase